MPHVVLGRLGVALKAGKWEIPIGIHDEQAIPFRRRDMVILERFLGLCWVRGTCHADRIG